MMKQLAVVVFAERSYFIRQQGPVLESQVSLKSKADDEDVGYRNYRNRSFNRRDAFPVPMAKDDFCC